MGDGFWWKIISASLWAVFFICMATATVIQRGTGFLLIIVLIALIVIGIVIAFDWFWRKRK